MKIDLSGIARRSGRETSVPVSWDDMTISAGSGGISISRIEPFVFHASNVEGKRIRLVGETEAEVLLPCDRCLSDVALTIPLLMDTVYPLEGETVLANEDDPDEALSDNILDIDVLLGAELLCNLPSKVLCRDDCKGLCPKCGQNLNLGECGCDRQVLDPRMAKILDVFSELKEV